MKFDSLGLPFKNSIEEEVASIVYRMVYRVRDELSRQYTVYKGEHQDYAGLCDIAVELLIEKINKYCIDNQIDVACEAIHGQHKHSTAINSCLWSLEHTWAKIKIKGVTIYADPTSGQFRRMYNYIPEFYVSTRKPKWYYPNSKNPVYGNKITAFINKHIKIPMKYPEFNGHISILKPIKVGIIEFFQFQVWGRIADSRNRQHYKWVRMR